MAKTAIAAGLEIGCKSLGIQLDQISKLYIAGGFGNYINCTNLILTGMIELPETKIYKMGNTALLGAKIFLFMDEMEVNAICKNVEHLNLEGHPDFQNTYVDKMIFR